ncbi:nuclear transport factor 2 family protein [Kribbella sp. NBC_00709]|uniref:nuclear transport factor 2 family protein n=1 Tax=Kribbella sp. NBC_00709 TaxID=2975972 RepID=UPI002E2A89E4|nr:nuclear transport factor 2 family protein [Kribbella sp. NBC_00709]
MTIKELTLHAFQEFANGNLEPLRPLLHENFVEHSPGNPSGRDAFIDFIARAPVAGAELDLRRVIADDTHVVVHYLMTTAETSQAVVDIWRFEGEQIVEHWDVVQTVPEI